MGRGEYPSTMELRNFFIFLLLVLSITLVSADGSFFTPINHNNNSIYGVSNITSLLYCNATSCYTIADLLSGGEPLWNANSSTVARTGDCPAGQFVQNTTTGGPECAATAGSGDITAVIAGSGLFGGGTNGDVTVNVSADTCGAGNISKYNGTHFSCVEDTGQVYTDLSNFTNSPGYYNLTDFDIADYYPKTDVDTNISDANNSMKSYTDGTFITQANEGNLNVNSTTWWAEVSGWVSGWFYRDGDDIAFNETKLNDSIDNRAVTTELDPKAYNGTLMYAYNWNATNESYYLKSNPFGFFNLTNPQTEYDPFWSGNQSLYSTTAEIIAFGYYNASDFVITDYFTKSDIIGFGYYNSTDFSISDYFTKVEVLAFDYYNSTDFVISDYFTKVEVLGFNYYNSTDFVITDYYTKTDVDANITYANTSLHNWIVSQEYSDFITDQNAELNTTGGPTFQNVTVGTSDGDNCIYFYRGVGTESICWNNGNTRFLVSDQLTATQLVATGGTTTTFLSASQDIYTTSSNDDLWLGSGTQGSALVRAYANGSLVIKGLIVTDGISDLESDPHWSGNQSNIYTKADVDTNISTLNTTMTAYVDSQDTAVNATMKTYVDSVNDSLATWTSAEIVLANTSVVAYVDSVNGSQATWTNAEIVLANTSQTDWANGSFVNVKGDTWEGNMDGGEKNLTNIDFLQVNRYIGGQPLDGALDSGIIWAEEIDDDGNLNLTHVSGLNITYPGFMVRLAKTTGEIKYCNVSAGSVLAPNDAHTVYYIDNDCAIQTISIATWLLTSLSPGGITEFMNVMAHSDDIENHNGVYIQNKVNIKIRKNIFYTDNLQVVSGLALTTEVFPNFTVSTGQYTYVLDIVNATTQNMTTGAEIEIFYYNGTNWYFDEQNGINLTQCQDGISEIVTCSTPSKYRRYNVYVTGFLDGDDETELHQELGDEDVTFVSLAGCLDVSDTPIILSRPTFYDHTAVPLYSYCGRGADSGWTGAFIDLRTVKTGDAGSGLDLGNVVLRDGSQSLTGNWNVGAFNVTVHYIKGLFNWTTVSNFLSFDGNTLTFDDALLNTTIGIYNDSATAYTDAVNDSLAIWTSAEIVLANTSAIAYVDSQDTAYNDSLATWAVNIGSSNLTKVNAANVTSGAFGTGAYSTDSNFTTEGIILEKDTTNHRIYDNATCVFIRSDTVLMELC